MTLFVTTFTTPAGPFSVALDTNLAVVATAFGDLAALRTRLKKCHVIRDTTSEEVLELGITDRRFGAIRAEISARFSQKKSGKRSALRCEGTAFQKRVWAALQRIPAGETRSYGEIARKLKTSARAVGRANATNPICLFVPCHRVIGADGALTGFAFGEEIKRRLLELEGVKLT